MEERIENKKHRYRMVTITVREDKIPILKQRADDLGMPLSRYLAFAGEHFQIVIDKRRI